MSYLTDKARSLARDLIETKGHPPEDVAKAAELVQEVLDQSRASILKEVASWHEARAKLFIALPSFANANAQEIEKARLKENQFAASYFRSLPEVEGSLEDHQNKIGTDSLRAAHRILFEGPFGETGEKFIERATYLIDGVAKSSAQDALDHVKEIEDDLPFGWRLENVVFVGTVEGRFKATLWKRGGSFQEGFGDTTRKAVMEASKFADSENVQAQKADIDFNVVRRNETPKRTGE